MKIGVVLQRFKCPGGIFGRDRLVVCLLIFIIASIMHAY